VEEAARAHLAGRTFADRRGEFRVDEVRVSGSGTRVRFALRLSGAIDGTAYLEGSPAFDGTGDTIAVTAIRPTDATIAAVGEDALHDFGAGLQLVLRFPVGATLTRQAEELGRTLNGSWGDGVTVRGGVARPESSSAYVSPEGLGVRVVLWGSASVAVAAPGDGSSG
jgi:hypothetical protein